MTHVRPMSHRRLEIENETRWELKQEGDAPRARLTDPMHPSVRAILKLTEERSSLAPSEPMRITHQDLWRIEEQVLRLNDCLVEQRKVIADQHQTYVNQDAELNVLREQIKRR